MLSLADAQRQLLAAARCRQAVQHCPTEQALGRILAHSLNAHWAVPPADNSAMDGYALRHSEAPGPLPVSQRITAGAAPQPLTLGTCARIFTGGEIPLGADTVIMQENAQVTPEGIRFTGPALIGQHIRRQGQDITQGQPLLPQGQCLNAFHIGLAASQGWPSLPVYAPLSVALVTSGNELTPLGQPLAPGHIYNSNGPCLASLLQALGCSLSHWVLDDHLGRSQALLHRLATEADVIITTGGVSAGEEDHLKNALAAIGSIHFWKLALKPGKPLLFGHIGHTPLLGLPGNPVSACVTFLLLAKPFLQRCMGSLGTFPAPYSLPLQLTAPLATQQRAEVLRVSREGQMLIPFSNQSSGVLSSMASSHGLALLPAGRQFTPGQSVDFWPFSALIQPW